MRFNIALMHGGLVVGEQRLDVLIFRRDVFLGTAVHNTDQLHLRLGILVLSLQNLRENHALNGGEVVGVALAGVAVVLDGLGVLTLEQVAVTKFAHIHRVVRLQLHTLL